MVLCEKEQNRLPLTICSSEEDETEGTKRTRAGGGAGALAASAHRTQRDALAPPREVTGNSSAGFNKPDAVTMPPNRRQHRVNSALSGQAPR